MISVTVWALVKLRFFAADSLSAVETRLLARATNARTGGTFM